MKNEFVKTKNVKHFLTGIANLSTRGAQEACLMIVDGQPGLGKTSTVNWWAVRNECIYLRAKKEWTPQWMMRDLITALNAVPLYSFEKMYKQALELLAQFTNANSISGKNFAIVVDEADHIARSSRCLETLRDLSDYLEIPFILVGMGIIRNSLKRFPQIASRIGQYVEFKELDLEDTRLLVNTLCNVQVEDKLIAFIHKVTNGYSREIKEAIASIDRFAARNPGLELVTYDSMIGLPLMNDRRNSNPIYVRG
ncbi:MAG: ATP-binding protein [Alphaproteobacteria bacterium]|nr:ATP-binding protein [Alphaproteobacteria bacterium]